MLIMGSIMSHQSFFVVPASQELLFFLLVIFLILIYFLTICNFLLLVGQNKHSEGVTLTNCDGIAHYFQNFWKPNIQSINRETNHHYQHYSIMKIIISCCPLQTQLNHLKFTHCNAACKTWAKWKVLYSCWWAEDELQWHLRIAFKPTWEKGEPVLQSQCVSIKRQRC